MSYFRFSLFGACGGGWTRTTELFRGQIYSLLQLPLCDSPPYLRCNLPGDCFEPMKGLEPPTGWLQISYSTNWVTSAFLTFQTTLFSSNEVAKILLFPILTKFFFIFHQKKSSTVYFSILYILIFFYLHPNFRYAKCHFQPQKMRFLIGCG